jgi:hypothetical protein
MLSNFEFWRFGGIYSFDATRRQERAQQADDHNMRVPQCHAGNADFRNFSIL